MHTYRLYAPTHKYICAHPHTHALTGHEPPLTEWEYLPHVGPRPPRGFVGLKNAGATCYMNAVLQQVRAGWVSVSEGWLSECEGGLVE